MKITQTELPITLERNNEGEELPYTWAITSGWDEKPGIISEMDLLDRMLCIPVIKGPLINRTELVSPFCGALYTELFEDDTELQLFPPDGHIYSEHFMQKGLFPITVKTSLQKFFNCMGYGVIADVLLSSDVCIYTMSGGFAGLLSFMLNSGETEKRIFEKIVTNLEANENTKGKIDVDSILDKMNSIANNQENLKNSILPGLKNRYGTSSVLFLEPSIDMESASGKITSDGVSAAMTAETPFFIIREDFPFHTKTTSDIIIASDDENIALNGSIKSIDAQELYILVKSEEEPSKLVDIIYKLSTKMQDEFASGEYGKVLESCGYVINNNFVGELSDSFYQSHIKDSGLLLKAEISRNRILDLRYSDLDLIITEAKKTIACLENIGLRAEPVYSDGKTIYNMSET